MGRRIIYLSVITITILLLALMQGGCGSALLEDLIVDVERALNTVLTINSDGNGTVDPSGEITVITGDVVDISATPNTGYVFLSWTGTGIVFGNRYAADTTVSLTGKTATITANFADALAVKDLTVNNDGFGSTNPSGLIPALPGSPVDLSATPDYSYEFSNWSITGGSPPPVFGDANSASTTVTVTENSIIQANFSLLQYWLTVTEDGNGDTTPTPDTPLLVTHGVLQPIVATPDTDYIFKNWSVESGTVQIDNSSSASTNATLTSGDATVRANFEYGFKLFYGSFNYNGGIFKCYSDWTNHQQVNSTLVGNINGLALDKSNKYVYFTDQGTRKVQMCNFDLSGAIDIATGLAYPYGIALDTTNNVLYWSDYGTREIKSVTLNPTGTPSVVADSTVQYMSNPHGMAYYNGKVFWVERNFRRIFEYDVVTTVITSWPIAGTSQPTDIAISPSQGTSGYLYCTDFLIDYIFIFDIASGEYRNSFANPCNNAKGIAIDDQNGVMYITSPYESNLYEIDIYDGTLISVFSQMGRSIKAIAVVPD